MRNNENPTPLSGKPRNIGLCAGLVWGSFCAALRLEIGHCRGPDGEKDHGPLKQTPSPKGPWS